MSTYSNRLQPALQNLLQRCSVLPPEIVMHDAYIGGRFRRTKITRKANDAAENLICFTNFPAFLLKYTFCCALAVISVLVIIR